MLSPVSSMQFNNYEFIMVMLVFRKSVVSAISYFTLTLLAQMSANWNVTGAGYKHFG